mmetsp:Transcript_22850/g.32219  ORF Transcript_22850/g.32219 Transcript_22850/m.32219 type:complete len:223 (-) Transcript_22850:128-796(-)
MNKFKYFVNICFHFSISIFLESSHALQLLPLKNDFSKREFMNGDNFSRRKYLAFLRKSSTGLAIFSQLSPASAANLPQTKNVDLSKTGTIETLIPIVVMRSSFLDLKSMITPTDEDHVSSLLSNNAASNILSSLKKIVPSTENEFKMIFDRYSDPVSYKQKFMDQNAFLVYYTKGFDGPGRPSIESGEDPKQIFQYGARNDVWVAYDCHFLGLVVLQTMRIF